MLTARRLSEPVPFHLHAPAGHKFLINLPRETSEADAMAFVQRFVGSERAAKCRLVAGSYRASGSWGPQLFSYSPSGFMVFEKVSGV